jgi:hypothetical protein
METGIKALLSGLARIPVGLWVEQVVNGTKGAFFTSGFYIHFSIT